MKYNNKFAYNTFNEEVLQLNCNVRCLSFQGYDALIELLQAGIYRPSIDKMWRDRYKADYIYAKKKLGYIPIWVFNPLQYGDKVQTTWDQEWFADASLWKWYLEFAGFEMETIHERVLMEFDVHSSILKADIVHDYGFCSVCPEIAKDSFIGAYRLQYPPSDSIDWFYPTIYPFGFNKENATFKEVITFNKD